MNASIVDDHIALFHFFRCAIGVSEGSRAEDDDLDDWLVGEVRAVSYFTSMELCKEGDVRTTWA